MDILRIGDIVKLVGSKNKIGRIVNLFKNTKMAMVQWPRSSSTVLQEKLVRM